MPGMDYGEVEVDDDEVATGDGLAKALYDEDVLTLNLPAVPTLGSTTAPYSAGRPVVASDVENAQAQRVGALRARARQANAYAKGIVLYMQANAVARVTSESLGKTPDPNNADTPIEPPDSPVDIQIF